MTVDHHEDHLAPWLESGRALIVGLDGADGAPLATRAWGILAGAATSSGAPSRVTVLLDAEDPQVVAALEGPGRIAVTGCDVHTLDSVQLKGTVRSLGPPTAAQSAASAEQVAATLAAIEEADAIPASLVARIVPGDLVAAEVDLHAVFDQTPGPGAGCAMGGDPGPAGTAPPGTQYAPGPDGRTPPGADTAGRAGAGVEAAPGPVPDLGELWHCFEGVVPAVIATVDAAGVPNVTYLSKVRSVGPERVALSNQFFSKTARNLAENPSAALLLIDPRTYDEYRLALRFERTERRGPVFEQLRADVEHLAVLSGMQDVFRLRAADIYRVTSFQRLEHAGAARATATARSPSMSAVGELAARLSRCGDAGDAVGVALRGLDELLGHDHSVFFLLDAEAGRLVVAGAHGYGAQAVGAELELGRGEAGLAAQRGEPVRIGNLGQARRYSGRVQRSFGLGPPGPGWELPVPELDGVASRMAVPAMALGQVVGVLVVESGQHAAHGPQDEAALSVVAGLLAAAVEASGAVAAGPGAPGSPPAPVAGRPEALGMSVGRGDGTVDGPARRVRFFEADGSVFLDGDYLIKGVAGRVLWSLLRQHRDEGRVDFTNREVRLDTSLGLPEFRDNLDSRLLLLQRRLDEREAPVRITRTGRGRFRLEVHEALRLELGGWVHRGNRRGPGTATDAAP